MFRLKQTATTVMGIDASTDSIAFAIIKDGKPVKWGKLKLLGSDIYEKMGDANRKTYALSKIIDVDYVAVERAVFINSPAVAVKLANIFGSIIGVLVANNIKVVDFAPITWQNYIGNKAFSAAEKSALKISNPGKSKSWYQAQTRKIRKQRTMDFFNKKFSIKIDDDDVGDAFGVAWMAYDYLTKRR